MLISEKQHQANQQNAHRSTGPKTPEGKAAVRFNALTWTLTARCLMLPDDDPAEYQAIWDNLAAEWRPQTASERHYLDQMVIAEWHLARVAQTEARIHRANLPLGRELSLLDRADRKRARHERAYTDAMHELMRLQKERPAKQAKEKVAAVKPAEAWPHPPVSEPRAPANGYQVAAAADSR